MVAAVVAMSQRLGIRTVAEGVETLDQMDRVRDIGCSEAQGYGIARPMPKDAMTRWLKLFTSSTAVSSSPMSQNSKVA